MKNEKLTRIEIIDGRLKQAGWNVEDRTQVVEEFDIIVDAKMVQEAATTYGGRQFSDYVLLGKDGKPLAVVEAKKSTVDANIGKEQAKQYCHNIQKQFGGELPFCFYTNGHDIFFWDLDNYPPKKVYGFPTRDDLERYTYIRQKRKALSGEFINTKIIINIFILPFFRKIHFLKWNRLHPLFRIKSDKPFSSFCLTENKKILKACECFFTQMDLPVIYLDPKTILAHLQSYIRSLPGGYQTHRE